MKEFARDFYQSKRWKTVSTAYMNSKNYLCERCGSPARICHHKIYLNAHNISDPMISLSFENLECLCQDCHNKEHSLKHSITLFNDSGDVIGVKKSGSEKEFEEDRQKIDGLLSKIRQSAQGETLQKAR